MKVKVIYNDVDINVPVSRNISYEKGINAIFMGNIMPSKGQT